MQSALWVALTLAAPAAAKEIYRRLGSRLEPWAAEIAFWSNAVYGVLPLYGAWVTGAVIGRDCGISGLAPANWLSGIVICGLLLVLLATSLRLTSVKQFVRAWTNPDGSGLSLFDEPRWAFYRGAGAVVFVEFGSGAADRLGIGRRRMGDPRRTAHPRHAAPGVVGTCAGWAFPPACSR